MVKYNGCGYDLLIPEFILFGIGFCWTLKTSSQFTKKEHCQLSINDDKKKYKSCRIHKYKIQNGKRVLTGKDTKIDCLFHI